MSNRYALIIANTEYQDPRLAQLTAPGRDAEDLAAVLKDPGLCSFDDVKVVLNETEPVVKLAIDEFFDGKMPHDTLLLYFSGHGVRDEAGALYLAVRNTNRARLRATAIKSDFINEVMEQSRAKRQVLVLDCCNSGAFSQGAKAATGGSIGTNSLFGGGFGRVILTASDSLQYAWQGDAIIGDTTDNSLFTHFLVEGLKGKADVDSNGCITVDSLYDYVYREVRQVTPKQTPSKFAPRQEGQIILRKITSVEDIPPAPLPPSLTEAMESPLMDVRLGAVAALAKLATGKNLPLARAARDALEHIAETDDSSKVKLASHDALEPIRYAERQAAQREADEKLAAEKRKEEEDARQREAQAEAERRSREEAALRAKEDAERRSREEAALRAREDAERRAREDAARREREEAERRRRVLEAEAAERSARQEAERQARERAAREAAEREAAYRRMEEEAARARRTGETTEVRRRREAGASTRTRNILMFGGGFAFFSLATVIAIAAYALFGARQRAIATAIAQATGTANAQATAIQQVQATQTQLVAQQTAAAQASATAAVRATSAAKIAATTTAVAVSTGQARDAFVKAAGLAARQIYDPYTSELKHDPNDGFIEVLRPDLHLANFIAEVTFVNPYPTSRGAWDYGFNFRDLYGNEQLRLYFTSAGRWVLENHTGDPDGTSLQDGSVPGFNTDENGTNSIRLICQGTKGVVFVNGKFLADLNIGVRVNAGDVALGTGFLKGHEIEGFSTGFRDFTVWRLP